MKSDLNGIISVFVQIRVIVYLSVNANAFLDNV